LEGAYPLPRKKLQFISDPAISTTNLKMKPMTMSALPPPHGKSSHTPIIISGAILLPENSHCR